MIDDYKRKIDYLLKQDIKIDELTKELLELDKRYEILEAERLELQKKVDAINKTKDKKKKS